MYAHVYEKECARERAREIYEYIKACNTRAYTHAHTQDHYNIVHHVPVEAGGRGKAGEIHFMDDGAEFAKMVERERERKRERERS